MRCVRCTGREQSICSTLSPPLLAQMAGASRVRRLRRGEVLTWEGDAPFDVGNVRDGALKLTASLRDGREQIVGVAWPGAFVGELFGEHAAYRLTALVATTICLFRRADFVALATSNPAIATGALRALSTDLAAARHSILALGRKAAIERVAALLIDMRRTGMTDADGVIEMPLNRQQMADLLGMTIETVSRKIRRLVALGIIELPGLRRFRVLDEVGLRRLAG